MGSASVIEPIAIAIQRTRRILFQPFELGKWLRLGFCAFLIGLGQAGGGSGSGGTGGGDSGSDWNFGTWDRDGLSAWIQENLALILIVASLVFLVLIGLGLLLIWLSSRGRFMLLDGIIHNRGAIKEPWREYRREGNSLFRFRFYLGLLVLGLISLILTLGFLIARVDLESNQLSGSGVVTIVIGFILVLFLIVCSVVISILLEDFVVPIMVLRRIPVLVAWQEFFQRLWQGNQRVFMLYFLMRFVLNIGVVILSLIVILLSCFIALIPYIGSVILLPLSVFQITYPLAFLEQFGSEWKLFAPDRHMPEST